MTFRIQQTDPWYTVYVAVGNVFRFELLAFFVAYIMRTVHDIKDAIRRDGHWYRPEEKNSAPVRYAVLTDLC